MAAPTVRGKRGLGDSFHNVFEDANHIPQTPMTIKAGQTSTTVYVVATTAIAGSTTLTASGPAYGVGGAVYSLQGCVSGLTAH